MRDIAVFANHLSVLRKNVSLTKYFQLVVISLIEISKYDILNLINLNI